MTLPMRLMAADSVASVAWRNGGGRTRELLTRPGSEAWQLRISLADIDAHGPFSAFEGTTRWFAVVAGSGVALRFGTDVRTLTPDSAPLQFDGAAPPDCELLDGPTRDLNLMLRSGTAAMRRADAGVAWTEPFAERGLFTLGAGRLRTGTAELALEPFTFVWHLPAGACRFEPATPGRAGYWLGWSAASSSKRV